MRSSALVCELFKRHGIGLVTLQPEFALSSNLAKTGKIYIFSPNYNESYFLTYNNKLASSEEVLDE